MIFRIVSAVVCVLAAVSAYLQLNDPDPERWFAIYAACALVALSFALHRPAPRVSLAVGAIAFLWACAIVPELWGTWTPSDLGASMINAKPQIEYGREFGGLMIVASYCVAAFFVGRKLAAPGAAAPA